MRQEVNSIFAPLFLEKARYYLLMGGRGAGRSTAASQYALSKLFAPEFMRGALMRGIHSDIRHSVWRELNDRISEQEVEPNLHITDNEMRVEYRENTLQAHGFRQSSSGHSAKLKSLASYNTVLIEEAEEIGEQEFRVLDDTLRTTKGDIKIILCLNSQPKTHWIIKRWFDLEESEHKGFFIPRLKPVGDAVFIGGTFRDNILNLDNHTVERYRQYEQTNSEYFYQMIEGLVPEVVRGKIYSGWKKIEDIPKNARLIGFGIDFGWFPDPACVVAIYYLNGEYIFDEVAYGNYLSNEVLAMHIKTVPNWDEVQVIADSAEPKSIEEIKNLGIKIIGSEKGKDSVNFGIKHVSQKRISVTERSKNLWTSYENYAWDEDKDGNPKGIPKHDYSDPMDAVRYGLSSTLEVPKKVSSYTPHLRELKRI